MSALRAWRLVAGWAAISLGWTAIAAAEALLLHQWLIFLLAAGGFLSSARGATSALFTLRQLRRWLGG